MIDSSNYYEKIKQVDLSSLPEVLKKSHDFVDKTTYKGTNWSTYNDNANIKRIIDTYFQKLVPFISTSPKVEKESPPKIKPAETHANSAKLAAPKKEKKSRKIVEQEPDPMEDVDFVERIPDELRFIRRYINLHNKRKGKDELLRFINALHRSILEKKIRKASPYAKEMEYIQDKLIKTYNTMTKPMTMQVSDKIITDYKTLLGQEKVMPSVMLMKRYITLNGKYGVKDKAAKLIEAMKKAATKKKVLKTDKYALILNKMFENLTAYVKNKSQKILSIQETELNGLNGVLGDCGCQSVGEVEGLDGLDCLTPEKAVEKPEVMSSMDFKEMQFKTLGFTGKYKQLIGDPAKGFTAMVYGRPKMGKSFLCVDFAGYLARNHGKVLYVAKEEGLDMTLQQKLKAKDVAHPNLFVAENLPNDLQPYEFIFLDSVNKLGLSSGDLETLKMSNPGKSFIYIFQTNKDGNFRGANEFQHDVDVVIEVPEKGKAVQNGRFNQGGEMNIFN